MSRLLVFLQFFLIAVVAFPFQRPAIGWIETLLFGAGLVVFAMAFLTMKWRTFTVMPEPKVDGELITRGIYAIVRHPMYLAVLLCAAAASIAYDSSFKWGMTAALAFVLVMKMRYEEKKLMERYGGYAAYRDRTKAIVPFIY